MAENRWNSTELPIRLALPDEAGLFYALFAKEDERLGCIGYVRIDFGHHGRELWHTWWPRGDKALNTSEFKSELRQVVDGLR